MNYAGKFDAAIPLNGEGSHSPGYVHVDSFTAKAHGRVPDGAVVVPDPNLIFNGEFKRSGLDLVLSHEGRDFVVHDYFRGEQRAALASSDGAHLTGDVVNALTGHVQVAQAAPGTAAAQVIGHVTKLSGSATAIRNGVSVILNNGDNVEKGDVVSTGADSTLGITFIDGTVFGLSSNARMVLNEMVYDPNGSNNSSLLSLVAGTITFVAGETAKHGDMKVDTPVATMGIRGTAVLTQINFVIPAGGGDPQPQASFQVLVEPNGTTGSYILFDKITLLPIATVNQAGQMIQISGGNVSISNALMSPDVQKLITDVFTLKFTDNNSNTKLTTNFTDTITPTSQDLVLKSASGAVVIATFTNLNHTGSEGPGNSTSPATRIPGQPLVQSLDLGGNVKTEFSLSERADTTGDTTHSDTISGRITFVDQNLGDRPTVSISLAEAPNYVYKNAGQQDVTGSLSALQKQDIAATLIQISVAPDGGNNNNGSAVWTYTIPDNVFDFLAAGETLTLTYMVRVDTNFQVAPESKFIPITITITGTNDKPVITSSVPTITFEGGTSVPGGPLVSDEATSGTLNFADVDLTDAHTVSVALTSATLPDGSTVPPGPLAAFQSAMSVAIASGADSTGDGTGTINWSLADLPVYLADFIPKGEVLTLVYTVTVKDTHGGTAQQTITVTITGTDAPAVVWIATEKPGAPSGGFWKDAANWATGTVPTIDDDVIVITDQLHGLTPSYPVTIDAAAYAKSLTMNDFGGPPPKVIVQSSLTIAGALNMGADSILTNAGSMFVGGKAEILDTSVLTNTGHLTFQGGGDFAVGTTITNSGTLELFGGTLKTRAEIHNAGGTLKTDAGATLIVDGTTVDGGTVTILGTLELDGVSLIENGTLNNSGTVNVKGTVEFAHETVDNASSGVIEVLANGWLTIHQGSSITNAGQITIDASGRLVVTNATIGGAGGVIGTGNGEGEGGPIFNAGLQGAGTITNDGEIDLTGDAVLSGGILNNNALFNVSGTGNALSDETVTNAGIIEVLAGGALAIDLGSTVDNSSGNVVIDGNAALTLDDATISGGAIKGAGTIGVTGASRIDGGATVSISTVTVESDVTLTFGNATVVGTEIANHGTVNVDASKTLTLNGASLTGGTLTVSGTLESTGTSAIDNAGITIAGTGAISVTSGTLTIDPATIHAITNHGLIEAITGGTLKLTAATITNTGGTISVDGTSKLYLTDVSINGGNLSNAGNLYSVSGSNTITAGVTNSGGTIEVQAGTLNLAGGITGVGTLIIDNGATLELGGANEQTATFAGGANTLKLDDTSHDFAGTIAGLATSGGTFTVTGDADINSGKGDALDFTASGGTADSRGNIILTPTGALTGATNGIVVTQNGIGDISLTTVGAITGQTGNGIVLHDGAAGAGDITATIGGGVSGAVGLDVVSHGDGNVSISNNGHITGATSFGINIDQDDADATGSTSITNTGSVVGADGFAAISIQENGTGAASITNSGTIGPDDAGAVTSTTYAIVETGGEITFNNTGHINGNISVATATFNNNAGGTWTVAGSGVFGDTSSIVNHGAIDLHGASISGVDLTIENDGDIDSWGTASITGDITNTATGSIEVHTGTLTLFGSLSGSVTGSVVVDAGATLEVKGTVSQTITLAGDGAELEIDTTDFGGSIAQLSANDKIDLTMIKWGPGTSAVYVPDADDPASGGVLTVTGDDGQTISLTLVGDYRNAHFAGSDEGGHTLITIHADDDAPVLDTAHATLTAGFAERENTTGSGASDPVPAATGSIDFTDIDLTDRPTATVTGQVVTSLAADGTTDLTASLTPGQIAALKDALTYGQTGKNNGTVTWSYSIADNALDFLAKDQTVKVVSTITLDDGQGQKVMADVVVTITGTNDAPTLDNTTLASVAGNDSNPVGSTISSLFTGKFHDADAGATLKAIAVTSDTATAAQGVWQYELAGTHQWVDIGAVSDTSALVLGPDTLLRFVPANGFTGTPDALGVHALDNTYVGGITTTSATATTDITAMSTDGTASVSDKLTTIGTSVTAPSASGPVINTEHFQVEHIRENSNEIITDLVVTDADSGAATDTFTLSVSTSHPDTSSVSVYPASGSLAQINTGLAEGAGIAYDPTGASTDQFPVPPGTDRITLTVTDTTKGLSDTVNFIFVEGANSQGITLAGAAGKDVIFATETSDTLIGGGAKDQFVFAPTSSQHMAQHTVNDFEVGLDKIDLRQFTSITSWTQVSSLAEQHGADTLLTLDNNDKILLKNTAVGSLNAGDFILHVS
ncbi:FecR domain-containing protein [Bradyrhizobium sp. CB1717]|uniref:FecR domain-containing protein n=1 Tax=Bradyrhizobium sp. CB1717 TaxID=3039154 RepID=UPI0024B0A30C|nr:FecR domain-containing protein [Bradyrhizobium sp. CB1717]WFU25740.1 FecR domain-containing protein [Bradyrhizobium sp. CB1717]